jgi:hypothetical protein
LIKQHLKSVVEKEIERYQRTLSTLEFLYIDTLENGRGHAPIRAFNQK